MEGDETGTEPDTPDVRPPASLNVSFVNLKPHHCRSITSPTLWNYDEITLDSIKYCGHPSIEGYSYCLHHKQIYYTTLEESIMDFLYMTPPKGNVKL